MYSPALSIGCLFSSTAALQGDPWFNDTQLLLTSLNTGGATAFIINKPFSRQFNELQEFSHCPPLTLYTGGPVQEDHLFFLHTRPDLIPNGVKVWEHIYLGGDFPLAIQHLLNGNLQPHEIRLFLGYCGWDKDELQEEITEGSWALSADNANSLF